MSSVAHLTVADCELRHARNRQQVGANGRTTYPVFCVSSILDESQLFHKHALEGVRAQMKEVSVISDQTLFNKLTCLCVLHVYERYCSWNTCSVHVYWKQIVSMSMATRAMQYNRIHNE